jgi:hypothetical protein
MSLSHVERSLTLSWLDKPFLSRSQVIQFRPESGGQVRILEEVRM